jgi:hypothetical protein
MNQGTKDQLLHLSDGFKDQVNLLQEQVDIAAKNFLNIRAALNRIETLEGNLYPLCRLFKELLAKHPQDDPKWRTAEAACDSILSTEDR